MVSCCLLLQQIHVHVHTHMYMYLYVFFDTIILLEGYLNLLLYNFVRLLFYYIPQDNSQYRVKTEVRGQLKVLETIDRIIDKRKTERENEQTLKAARSRSKGADPVKAAQIREEARQVRWKPDA